jgi:hypothetical protein
VIYEDGRVHVRAEPCAQCLLSADRIVSGARARQLIEDTRAVEGASFICHRSQVSDEHVAICRAWFDRFGLEDVTLRLAVVMDVITYVAPVAYDEVR